MRISKNLVLWTILALSGMLFVRPVSVSYASESASDSTVRRIGSRLELFTDDALIASMTKTSLKMHPPVRKEVVFSFDAPWEGGLSGYVTVMADDDGFRMYYRGGGDLSREYTCMARSRDGVR